MIEVIPAILEKDFEEIERKIHLVEPYVNWAQIDIADGTLVNNKTYADTERYTSMGTKLGLEVHMMVRSPLKYFENYKKAGFKRMIAHIEGDNVNDFIVKCQESDVEVGLAIDGLTPIEKVYNYIEDIACCLFSKRSPALPRLNGHHQNNINIFYIIINFLNRCKTIYSQSHLHITLLTLHYKIINIIAFYVSNHSLKSRFFIILKILKWTPHHHMHLKSQFSPHRRISFSISICLIIYQCTISNIYLRPVDIWFHQMNFALDLFKIFLQNCRYDFNHNSNYNIAN